jgi:hypothetical protein
LLVQVMVDIRHESEPAPPLLRVESHDVMAAAWVAVLHSRFKGTAAGMVGAMRWARLLQTSAAVKVTLVVPVTAVAAKAVGDGDGAARVRRAGAGHVGEPVADGGGGAVNDNV